MFNCVKMMKKIKKLSTSGWIGDEIMQQINKL